MKKETHLHPMVLEKCNALYKHTVQMKSWKIISPFKYFGSGRTGVVDNSLNVQYPSLKD